MLVAIKFSITWQWQLAVTTFTMQEVNAVYNIKKEQDLQCHQSHLLQNIRNTTVIADQSYSQSLIESYGDQLGGQLGG